MKSPTRPSIILTAILVIVSLRAIAQTPAPAPAEQTFKISGSVGLPGVAMRGFPGDPMTDENGHYSAQVPAGWSGTVTPFREGFVFEPVRRTYNPVRENHSHVNYAASRIVFTIAGNAGAPGVEMQGLPDNPVTDDKGNYSIQVPYRWSGKVTPVLPGCVFAPPSIIYPPVLTDRLKQDYRITEWYGSMDASPQAAGRSRLARGGTASAMAQNVLIVPTTSVDATQFAETADDMRVMMQILREKANEQRATAGRTVLPDFGPIFGSTGRGAEAIYIQGYGAIFVMEVGFPLARPSQPGVAGKQAQPRGGDPVWQQAQQRLAGTGQDDPAEPTNAFNPDQFKESMIRSLRHAANIRHLNANEWVILTVIGQSRSTGQAGGEYRDNSYGGGFNMEGGSYMQGGGSFNGSGGGYMNSSSYNTFSAGGGRGMAPGSQAPGGSTPGSVMTIQVKKSDIDAFASDNSSYEQFSQKVKVFDY